MAVNPFLTETLGGGILGQFLRNLDLQIKKLMNLGNRFSRRIKIEDYYNTHDVIKIQVGSGGIFLEGFLNTDLLGKIPVDITKELPFPSNSVDLIYSNHVIEHISIRHFKYFLRESHRVLKKGGIHIIATPSLKRIIEAVYYDKDLRKIILDAHKQGMRETLDPATFLNKFMHISYGHKFIYDFEAISRLAKTSGYSAIKITPNFEIPDEGITKILPRYTKEWAIETETYLLTKEPIIEPEHKKVTISTINWNVADQLELCIESVLKYCKYDNYEWFIIDNNSERDGFDDIMKKYSNHDNFRFIKNKKNVGGYVENSLIDKMDSPYLLFLQPDVILKNDAIKILLDFMDSHPEAGAASAKFSNPDGSPQIYFSRLPSLTKDFFTHTGAGRFIDEKFLSKRNRIHYHYKDVDLHSVGEIEHIGLVCYIMRKDIILKYGYVHDPHFVFSHGDYELNKRVRDLGYKIFLVPSAEVIHYQHSSYKKKPDPTWYKLSYEKSKLKYFRKHHKVRLQIAKAIIIFESLSSLFSLEERASLKDVIKRITRILLY